jgi:hypothetical protein
MKLQRLGGYACVLLVLVEIASSSILISIFRGFTGLDIYDPVKMIAAYQGSISFFWAFYILGIFNGILTLLVVLALRERMQAKAPTMMLLAVVAASAFAALSITGMIGGFFRNILLGQMNDISAFRVFLVLHEFFFSAAASAMGWAFLMIGCAAIRTRGLPRALAYAILPFSISMIIQFSFAVSQFQLGNNIASFLWLIVFVWLGVVLLRKPKPIAA